MQYFVMPSFLYDYSKIVALKEREEFLLHTYKKNKIGWMKKINALV